VVAVVEEHASEDAKAMEVAPGRRCIERRNEVVHLNQRRRLAAPPPPPAKLRVDPVGLLPVGGSEPVFEKLFCVVEDMLRWVILIVDVAHDKLTVAANCEVMRVKTHHS